MGGKDELNKTDKENDTYKIPKNNNLIRWPEECLTPYARLNFLQRVIFGVYCLTGHLVD